MVSLLNGFRKRNLIQLLRRRIGGGIMTFEQYKKEVFRLAKRKVYLLPNSDVLFLMWQNKQTPAQVVKIYCEGVIVQSHS